MTRLLINIDHVATLRNARREKFPDPVQAAIACEKAGADGVVFHLREDRRHIKDADVRRLRKQVTGKLDFECSLAPDVLDVCMDVGPDLATLVPERREEITTESGIDVLAHGRKISAAVTRLHQSGIKEVALFIDPVRDQLRAARDTGADAVELHTGDYANALVDSERQSTLAALADGAAFAQELGLRVHAGHGLDYQNFSRFAAAVRPVEEVSIGFAIVARSILVGMETAVREMLDVIRAAESSGDMT